ncbi:ABC transporter permease [Parapedobacter sp. DT-150]|uniref:ABC transporter permease n=1 Tax=Parapedobacter sp. DT-150 TaxID=3396162 RepID=UPI003F1AA75D
MIKNYLKIAWRNLVKHRLYSTIKIGGFAFSIAACILISLYILHETSYDQFYPDADRLYRVVGQFNNEGNTVKGVAFEAPLAETMKADFSEIELAGRLLPNPLFGAGSNQVSTDDHPESTHEGGVVYMDQELLELLQLTMVHGDRRNALSEPNTVVLTASKARNYFAKGNPVGKIIYLNNDKSKPYTIKGVIADIPTNSHLHGYDFFLTLTEAPFYDGEQTNWLSSNYVTYFKIKPGTDIGLLASKITKNVLENYKIPTYIANGRQVPEFLKTAQLHLQPLSAIHLHSHDFREYNDAGPKGDIRFVWLFGAVAGFILLIACVNFINLATAKSASRAKEIGLRKVVGSYRSALIGQFLSESMLYSLLSVALGVLLAWGFLPLFNQLAGKQLVFPWSNPWLFPIIGGSAVGIGLLAGLYPALYLSSFRPAQVLKGQVSRGAKNPLLRNGLVVFQFTTSIILIIGTLIINSQMHFILNREIGFDKDQVMVIQGTHTLGKQVATLKEELRNIPGVQQVTVGDYLPVHVDGVKRNGNPFWKAGRVDEDLSVSGQLWRVDADYIPTLGIRLHEGRNFNKELATDSAAVIINQRLAKSLNLGNPIGARITNGGADMLVIGVVEDFNFETMKDEVGGLCMALGNSPSMMAVKISGENLPTTLAAITAQWKEFAPDQAIRFTFLDESFANMYRSVQRTGTIFTCFAILAIVIACLGLFGLAAFTTEQRTKEIGIRKVLGASVGGIVQLLSRDFVKLVLFALVIASPIAWWAMNQWLQDFAYRIEIQWWVFVIAGLAAVLIALLTVSWQAIRAAVANPVDSLRDE